MAIPFRDQDEIDALGFAGYLKLRRDGDEYSGAIFIINARGEPVHFIYNKVRVTSHFMWVEEDLVLAANRCLVRSLISVCPVTPVLMLCQDSETTEQLLEHELRNIPLVGRISTGELLDVTWHPQTPSAGTPAFVLWEMLSKRGLIHEPFTRTAKGMAEILRTIPTREITSGIKIAPESIKGGT